MKKESKKKEQDLSQEDVVANKLFETVQEETNTLKDVCAKAIALFSVQTPDEKQFHTLIEGIRIKSTYIGQRQMLSKIFTTLTNIESSTKSPVTNIKNGESMEQYLRDANNQNIGMQGFKKFLMFELMNMLNATLEKEEEHTDKLSEFFNSK